MRSSKGICAFASICTLICAVLAPAQEGTPAAPGVALSTQRNEGESPSGKIRYTLQGREDSKQLFLYAEDRPDERVALCETYGWGNMVVSFSPNEEWIVVQDGGASLGVDLR